MGVTSGYYQVKITRLTTSLVREATRLGGGLKHWSNTLGRSMGVWTGLTFDLEFSHFVCPRLGLVD